MKPGLLLPIVLYVSGAVVGAQSTTGTIRGHIADDQGLPLPGVTISLTSANLQGTRVAVTSENGDYILTLLPSGTYAVTFELSGFQRQQRTVSLAPTQDLPVEVRMGPATLTEEVEVVGRAADVLMQTAQVATNFKQELIATLPTNRDINATLLLAPAVHPTGPSGNYSIAGSMSFDNLFMVNGVTVNENLRGQAQNLYIEDAIQETTVASAGISSEYGRFSGGVVNVITKSGGNLFTGSFRNTLHNDDWRALVPKNTGDTFANDTKIDKVVPTYEYTAGGPIMRDQLWFFTAGRLQTQESARQLVLTNVPYTFSEKSRRYEIKGTYSLNSDHRFQVAYNKVTRDQLNNTFSTALSMDLNSLEDRRLPESLFTVNYSGVVTSTFFVEGRYSERRLHVGGSGSKFTDRLRGTLLVDPSGRRYWSATFCGVCPAEERDNRDIFVKGAYFLSTSRYGSHNMAFGYDNFKDARFAENHQSGSDFRFLNAPAIVQGTDVLASFVSGTTQIQWQPIFVPSNGTDFRTHALFYNDSWRIHTNLTANLGVRLDRNRGVNGAGELIAKGRAVSPRLGVVWDPGGDQRWTVTASTAKYVAALLNSIADSTSAGGNADLYRFLYRGPDINVGTPTLSNEAAIQRVFDWFTENGGASLPTLASTIRGVTPRIGDSLESPYVWEYAGGVARQFGVRAVLRADVSYRDFKNFYAQRTDTRTGRVADTRPHAPASVRGRDYDLTLIENETSGLLKRRYAGMILQGQYRVGTGFDVGGNYTLSRLWGNVDGENVVSGPVTDSSLQYPEYKQASWNFPEGDLSIDQRHRARFWINYGVPWVSGLTLSLLQAIESGVPYSASNQNSASFNGVDPSLYVPNPGYVTPPDALTTQYYFTARDAFRTEGQRRSDVAVNYAYKLAIAGSRALDLFIQGQIVNVFNQFQLCGCGASVFNNGGNVQNQYIDSTVRTAASNPTLYQRFNPFTTMPVEGVHWAKGPAFGRAVNRFAYTSPRHFRLTFGVRF